MAQYAGQIEGVEQRSSSMTVNAMEQELDTMMDCIAAFVTKDAFRNSDDADNTVEVGRNTGQVIGPIGLYGPADRVLRARPEDGGTMTLTAREDGTGVWEDADGNAYAYNRETDSFTKISCTLNGRPIDASLVEESGTGLFIARETSNIENNTQLIAKTEQQQLGLRKIVERAMGGG